MTAASTTPESIEQLKQQLATSEAHSVELAEKLAESERIRMAEGGQDLALNADKIKLSRLVDQACEVLDAKGYNGVAQTIRKAKPKEGV